MQLFGDLMQPADGTQVEIQFLRGQIEPLRNQVNGFLELHQRNADIFDIFRAECLFFQAPDGLTLHQLADEFNQAQHELHNRLLHIFGIWIPPERGSCFPGRDVLSALGDAFSRALSRATVRPRIRAAARASALFFHAVLRFFAAIAGPPMTFLISLIKSCGRQGLVMTTSHPALFALSEWPAIA